MVFSVVGYFAHFLLIPLLSCLFLIVFPLLVPSLFHFSFSFFPFSFVSFFPLFVPSLFLLIFSFVFRIYLSLVFFLFLSFCLSYNGLMSGNSLSRSLFRALPVLRRKILPPLKVEILSAAREFRAGQTEIVFQRFYVLMIMKERIF